MESGTRNRTGKGIPYSLVQSRAPTPSASEPGLCDWLLCWVSTHPADGWAGTTSRDGTKNRHCLLIRRPRWSFVPSGPSSYSPWKSDQFSKDGSQKGRRVEGQSLPSAAPVACQGSSVCNELGLSTPRCLDSPPWPCCASHRTHASPPLRRLYPLRPQSSNHTLG